MFYSKKQLFQLKATSLHQLMTILDHLENSNHLKVNFSVGWFTFNSLLEMTVALD